MNGPSEEHQNQYEDLVANLVISVDKQGIMEYNCDWDGSPDGITAVASIFYKIMFEELPETILAEIKRQCVLDGREESYTQILNFIASLAIDNGKDDINNDVVVQPDQVFHL